MEEIDPFGRSSGWGQKRARKAGTKRVKKRVKKGSKKGAKKGPKRGPGNDPFWVPILRGHLGLTPPCPKRG